jgi:hypothetical protein
MKKKHKRPLIRKKPKGKRFNHAQARFRQRYGRTITGEQMQALVELAEQNKCRSIFTDKNKMKRAEVLIGAELIRFVYNPENRQVITFLPNH